jgi:hypothetical protein
MNWKKISLRTFLSVAGVVLLLVGPAGLGYGDPITSITDLNNFRDTRSLNDVGLGQGDRIQYGAEVVPNDAAGTMMAATQGTFRKPTTGYAPCGAFTVNPNFCANSTAFNPALTGQWNLEFVNGGNTAIAVTPSLTASAAAAPAPFPVNVTISGSGTTPTLSWTVPTGFAPNAIRVQVFDKNSKNSQGVSDIIYSPNLSGTATSFTIPSTVNLSFGTPYSLGIQLIETRNGLPSTGSPNSNISRRSNSFFDFTPISGDVPPDIHLPIVGPPPPPSSGYGATYQFSITNIVPGVTIFIDPYLAVGYDYAIGPGNPKFASVLLPAVQSNPFILSYQGPSGQVSVPLPAGQEYLFPSGGVDHFSVREISFSAYLDPGNVTAFITGLTFTGAGNFTGTMTPVIALSPPSPVFACAGFQSPADKPINVKKNRAIPLNANLFHIDDSPVVGTDIVSDPVLKVFFKSKTGGGTLDVTGAVHSVGLGTDGNRFVFTTDGIWQFNLKTPGSIAKGTYTLSIESGDKSEYLIDPTCKASVVVE